MKVALVYDRVNKFGGAERVLLALHKIFPKAPLYTSVYNPKKAPWAKSFRIYTSFLQRLPFVNKAHELLAYLMPQAFEGFNFDKYDLVISVTSEAAKGILTKPQTRHICYCLTPTRYLWSGYDEYFQNTIFRILTKPLIIYLRWWDKIASKRPDAYIAISEEVRKRIKKYYGRESIVVYPPATLQDTRYKIQDTNDKGYFLVVSRISKFTSYKRIGIAVEAVTRLGVPLKVIGEGNFDSLKEKAGPKVEFVGKVTDEELIAYYKHCKALIFPGNEDFGLVMVEAQYFGKPVIAYRKGGALEIIQEGKTGEFFDTQSATSLIKVLKSFRVGRYNKRACIRNAERFRFKVFKRNFIEIVKYRIQKI